MCFFYSSKPYTDQTSGLQKSCVGVWCISVKMTIDESLPHKTSDGVQSYLGDIVSLVPDHCSKSGFTIKEVVHIFDFLVFMKGMFILY